jgi:hypothetical protein
VFQTSAGYFVVPKPVSTSAHQESYTPSKEPALLIVTVVYESPNV